MLEKIPNYDKLLSTLKKFGVESTQDQNLFLENCEIKYYRWVLKIDFFEFSQNRTR
jgi:hypothetical protein